MIWDEVVYSGNEVNYGVVWFGNEAKGCFVWNRGWYGLRTRL